MKCQKTLFAFMFILLLTSNLNAQEVSPAKTDEPTSVIADMLPDAEEALESALDVDEAVTEEADEVASEEEKMVEDDEVAVVADATDEREDVAVDEEGEYLDEDLDEDESEEYDNTPVSIKLNEYGELVGQARASVSGNWLPVEANIAIVRDGILLNKIVAEEDGSFAFPDIAPGSYRVYGTASSFCGQRAVTVVSNTCCCDNNCGKTDCPGTDCQNSLCCGSVGLGLTQDSQGACYSGLGSAPAATFSEGVGFGGGFSASAPISGGFAGGAGAAGGVSGLRLLAVGGIVTAIAVGDGDDDEASPSN